MTMPTYEQIAMRSYLIWEEEGRPNGNDIDHWLQAEAELRALFNPPPRSPMGAKAKAKMPAKAKAKAPARKAAAAAPKAKAAKATATRH